MILPLTHQLLEELIGQTVDSSLDLKGYAYLKNNRVLTALPITPIETRGWGTEGLVGEPFHHDVNKELVERSLADLKKDNARLLISFSKLPLLASAGRLNMMQALGLSGPSTLSLTQAPDNEDTAALVAECQKNSQDFNEIPPNADRLDSYRGHGDQLWRRWEDKGVLLVNEVDASTYHLAFVGLIPSARGQKMAVPLMREALFMAGPARTLTTAVDTRNIAACKAYLKLGFTITEERKVYFNSFE